MKPGVMRRSYYVAPKDAHWMVKRIFAEMLDRCLSYEQVSEMSGIRMDTLRSWRTRRTPSLLAVEVVLLCLGVRIELVSETGERDSQA